MNKKISSLSKHAALAKTALLKEIYLTPKPGLVDQDNNGAHHDMNLQTFICSIEAITEYLEEFYLLGFQNPTLKGTAFLTRLRLIGILCEKAMFSATHGINTHKGGIFAFALLCSAIGRLEAKVEPCNSQTICHEVAAMCENITAELTLCNTAKTAGEKIYQKHGLTGARGQAENGYLIIQEMALPLYKELAAQNIDEDLILCHVLLHLIMHNDDTNLVSRGGIEGLYLAQTTAKELLSTHHPIANTYLNAIQQFDQLLIKHHLSPGGSADLLSVTWFLAQYDL